MDYLKNKRYILDGIYKDDAEYQFRSKRESEAKLERILKDIQDSIGSANSNSLITHYSQDTSAADWMLYSMMTI